MANIQRSATRVNGFQDEEMDFQLIRQMGSSSYGAASVGEALSIVNRIEDGIPDSWVKEFTKLAKWQEQDAKKRLAKNHFVSAREQFFKASNSYRAAEYYTSSLSEMHQQLGLKARDCFLQGIQSINHTFKTVKIPYKNRQLPVYFCTPKQNKQNNKTLMIVSGFDGTTEEEYFMRGISALERGYNVALFAGPGQMDLFRFYDDTYFEPDFENPTAAVIDYLATLPEVDMQRLALLGISFGGYFATRAASRDNRIKALIANSPIINLFDYLSAFTGGDMSKIPDEEDFTIADIPHIPDSEMPPQIKSMSENLMIRFGGKSFKDTFIYLKEFIVGDSLSSINCPCFAMVGAGEGGEPKKQADEFCKTLGSKVTVHDFTEFEGADTHCQVGNVSYANSVFLDWLDDVF